MAGEYQELEKYLSSLEILDTHEHLPISNSHRNQDTDVFSEYCTYYFNRDLITAGMPMATYQQLFDKSLTVKARWNIAEPFWEKCRFTGYGQNLDAAVKELYGAQRLDGDSVEEIDRCIKASLYVNHYEKVLKEKCRIVTSLLDVDGALEADRKYFTPVVRIDPYIKISTLGELQMLEHAYGKSISRLEHILDAFESYMRSAVEKGALAFKTGLAYERNLTYEKATFSDAEKAFNHSLCSDYALEICDRPFQPEPAFENYMMHFALSVADELKIPVQFHTGLQEGNGNLLCHSNPELLNTLFLQYPRVKFDIFHIGYPYQHVLGGLAKMFPNVYIDMCWAHIVSPESCIRSLSEWLEVIPYNKICGFGGDHCFVDGVAGHRILAIKNIAAVLGRKIKAGLFTEKQAFQIAEGLMYGNAAELFGIGGNSR